MRTEYPLTHESFEEPIMYHPTAHMGRGPVPAPTQIPADAVRYALPFPAHLVPGSAEYVAECRARIREASADDVHDADSWARLREEDRRAADEFDYLYTSGIDLQPLRH